MSSRDTELKLRITADGTIAQRALRSVRKAIGGMREAAIRAAAGFAKMAAGITAVSAAAATWVLGRIIGDSVEDAEALDRQMRTIEATIKATGGAAGLTAKQVDEMARRLDEATLGSAAEFRKGANALLTFKSVGADAFETVLRLAKDLEAAGLGGFQDNVKQLGKALEDPVLGMTALRRAGVSFSDAQREIVKELVATGQAARAQGLILQEVAGQVGGAAAAAGGGLSGLKDLAGKLFTDIREQIGSGLLTPLSAVQARINALLQRLSESGMAARFGQALGDAWQHAADKALDFFEAVDFDALIQRVRTFTQDAIGLFESLLAKIGGLQEVTATAVNGAVRVLAGFKTVWLGVYQAVELVFAGISGLASKVVGAYAAVVEGAAAAGLASEETALKARAAAESLGEAATKAKESSIAHYNEMIAAGRVLLGVQQQNTAEVEKAAGAEEKRRAAHAESKAFVEQLNEELKKSGALVSENADRTGQAAEQTAEDFRRIAEEARLNFESIRDSGKGSAEEITRAWGAYVQALDESQRRLASIGSTAADASAAVAGAFKRLGVQSSAELTQIAQQARADFEAIRDSGTASAQDIANAYEEYAKRAAASGDKIEQSYAQRAGLQLGLVSASEALEGSSAKVADNSERAAAAAERDASARQRAAVAAEQESDAIERRSRKVTVDYEQFYRNALAKLGRRGGRLPDEAIAGDYLGWSRFKGGAEYRQRIIDRYREWEKEFLLRQKEEERAFRQRREALKDPDAQITPAPRSQTININVGSRRYAVETTGGTGENLLEALRQVERTAA